MTGLAEMWINFIFQIILFEQQKKVLTDKKCGNTQVHFDDS